MASLTTMGKLIRTEHDIINSDYDREELAIALSMALTFIRERGMQGELEEFKTDLLFSIELNDYNGNGIEKLMEALENDD